MRPVKKPRAAPEPTAVAVPFVERAYRACLWRSLFTRNSETQHTVEAFLEVVAETDKILSDIITAL
jgi:hypothetical protein